MLNFDKLLAKVDVPQVLSSLFEGWQPGQNVSCPLAETRHERGADTSKSMSVSADGKVFCHACGYKATNLVNLYIDMHGHEFADGCEAFYSEFIAPVVPTDYVERAHKALMQNGQLLRELERRRGVTAGTARQYKLGWDARFQRLAIPVYDDVGMCVNVRKYDLLKRSNIKIFSYDKGYGTARLFPISALAKQKVYVFEGEMDTLLALSVGLNAITLTTGAGVWPEAIAKQFLDKTVILVPDLDKPGLAGMDKRAALLSPYAHSLQVVKLPLTGEKNDKDFTDYMLKKAGRSVAKFLALRPMAWSPSAQAQEAQKKECAPANDDDEVLSFKPTPAEAVNLERAKTLFTYLRGAGAFFKNIAGTLYFAKKGGDIFRVSSQDSHFLGFLSGLSPLLNTAASSGKFILQHLVNKAQALCTFSSSAFWSMLKGHDLFLYGPQGTLFHLRDGKVHKMPNAVNAHNVLLELPAHTQPFKGPAMRHNDCVQLLWDKVLSNIAISNENRYLLMCWALGVIFRVEVRNKPLLRLSASTAYGKSTASKLLSILFYGEEMLHHSASTMASMYSLAAEYPLLIFDNLETRNMVQALEDFLIVAATGGMKTKRVLDTTSAVAFERIDSLVLTNGIEPFSKHEILNRTIELPLNIDRFGKAHFHELKVIEELKATRDQLMFSLMELLSKRVVPRFMNNEVQRIARHFDAHSKDRFNEYFGVMAVILDALWPYMPLKGYALPHDLVNYWIASQNVSAKASDEGTNDVLYFLDTFTKRRANLMDACVPVRHKDGKIVIKCTTRDLLSDFRLLAKHLNMRCPWQNERQLGTRLADASEVLHKAGWTRRQAVLSGRRVYEFSRKADAAN